MYKVTHTDEEIIWNSVIHPLLTLADEYGGRAQIVNDNHCLVLLLRQEESQEGDMAEPRYKPTYWWFDEAVEALMAYNLLQRRGTLSCDDKPLTYGGNLETTAF